jgi:hypothetical protein
MGLPLFQLDVTTVLTCDCGIFLERAIIIIFIITHWSCTCMSDDDDDGDDNDGDMIATHPTHTLFLLESCLSLPVSPAFCTRAQNKAELRSQ